MILSYPEPDITACGVLLGFANRTFAELYNLPVTSHGAHDLTVSVSVFLMENFTEIHGFGLENLLRKT